MARPGLEPGTPRFSAVVSSRRQGGATSQRPSRRTEEHSAHLALVRPATIAGTTRARVTCVAGLSRCDRSGREPTAPRDARCSSLAGAWAGSGATLAYTSEAARRLGSAPKTASLSTRLKSWWPRSCPGLAILRGDGIGTGDRGRRPDRFESGSRQLHAALSAARRPAAARSPMRPKASPSSGSRARAAR